LSTDYQQRETWIAATMLQNNLYINVICVTLANSKFTTQKINSTPFELSKNKHGDNQKLI